MDDIVATAIWKRLDTDGHDCCRLIRGPRGWRLSGCATFLHEGEACMLPYEVDCDGSWRTLSARVDGSVGFDRLTFDIARTANGDWLVDGQVQPAAAGCIDLDLGFTPATNLIAIRRLGLAAGAAADSRAAYYREFVPGLGALDQTYRRSGDATYAYASPAHGFSAELAVDPVGFVTDYPGLWSGTVATA